MIALSFGRGNFILTDLKKKFKNKIKRLVLYFLPPTLVAYGLGRQNMSVGCSCFRTQNAGLKSSTVPVPKPDPQFDV